MNKAPNPFLKEIVRQVGTHNILSISGGPVIYRETGISLKVGRGYFVEIDLMPSDTYTVKRVYQNKKIRIVKGVEDDIYWDQLSDSAYRASCFVNVSFGSDTK